MMLVALKYREMPMAPNVQKNGIASYQIYLFAAPVDKNPARLRANDEPRNGIPSPVAGGITRCHVMASSIQVTSEPSPQLSTPQRSNMPHVEVLPNSTASVAPGWTYVVDTGYDPSKVAINPKNKKRAAAQPGGQRGENELSARQQTAIARRIAELERDNDPKQSIAIPGKPCMYLLTYILTHLIAYFGIAVICVRLLTSVRSCSQDTKHATHNTISETDQALA